MSRAAPALDVRSAEVSKVQALFLFWSVSNRRRFSSVLSLAVSLFIYALLTGSLLQSTVAKAEPKPAKQADWHYTLRPSDKIASVSKRLLNRKYKSSDLIRYNRIDDPNKLLPGSILKIPMDWLKQQPKPASILSSTGQVLIKRTRDSKFKTARPTMKVHVGDEISTRNGSALIKFADGTLLRLEENSTLMFNKLSHYGETGMVDTLLRLKKGSISTEVTPLVKGSRYEIRTPSAVAAVRGTSFRLEASPTSTKLEVTEGTVEFSHEHGTEMIMAGQGAKVVKGKARVEKSRLPPAPKPMFADGAISELPANLAWNKQNKAKEYRYQLIDKDQNRLQEKTLKSPEVELANLQNGDYQVAMRSIDNKGYEGMDNKAEISIDLETETPTLLAPLNGTIIDSPSPQFSWQVDKNVLGKLEVADDKEFKKIVRALNVAPNTLTRLDKKLNPGTYFWRVSTPSGSGGEIRSNVQEFSVRGNMKPVKILSVNYIDSQVGLFWNSIKETEGYTLQLSDDKAFSNILKEETIGKTSAHLRLKPGKRYYARVKGIANDLYTSEYGPTKELFVQPK